MQRAFEIVSFPSKKKFFDALLTGAEDNLKRVVVFRVEYAGDSARVFKLGMSINRIKRVVDGRYGETIWQFSGMLRFYDENYVLEDERLYAAGECTLYKGGVVSERGTLALSPRSQKIVVFTEEEFLLFQR